MGEREDTESWVNRTIVTVFVEERERDDRVVGEWNNDCNCGGGIGHRVVGE